MYSRFLDLVLTTINEQMNPRPLLNTEPIVFPSPKWQSPQLRDSELDRLLLGFRRRLWTPWDFMPKCTGCVHWMFLGEELHCSLGHLEEIQMLVENHWRGGLGCSVTVSREKTRNQSWAVSGNIQKIGNGSLFYSTEQVYACVCTHMK